VTLPLVGWLSGRYGGRAVYLGGLVGFIAGSFLVGLAWDLPSAIAFRVLQGLGGGLLEPGAVALAGSLAPKERVGAIMGRFSLVINAGPILGPLFGALLADAGLWRWIFLINLPLGLMLFVVSLRMVPARTDKQVATPVDPLGIGLLVGGFVAVLLAVSLSNAASGATTMLLAALGIVLLAAYAIHAVRAPAPLLDLRLMAQTGGFAAAVATMGVVGLLVYSQLTVLPLYAEQAFDLTGAARGLLVASLGVGLFLAMPNAGRLSDTFGPRRLVSIGGLTAAVACAGFAVAALQGWSLAVVCGLLFATGLGVGAIASPTFASVYRSLPVEAAAQGTTALFIAVQLMAAVGATVVAAITAAIAAPVPAIYLILAAAGLLVLALARLLPGRPDAIPPTSGAAAGDAGGNSAAERRATGCAGGGMPLTGRTAPDQCRDALHPGLLRGAS